MNVGTIGSRSTPPVFQGAGGTVPPWVQQDGDETGGSANIGALTLESVGDPLADLGLPCHESPGVGVPLSSVHIGNPLPDEDEVKTLMRFLTAPFPELPADGTSSGNWARSFDYTIDTRPAYGGAWATSLDTEQSTYLDVLSSLLTSALTGSWIRSAKSQPLVTYPSGWGVRGTRSTLDRLFNRLHMNFMEVRGTTFRIAGFINEEGTWEDPLTTVFATARPDNPYLLMRSHLSFGQSTWLTAFINLFELIAAARSGDPIALSGEVLPVFPGLPGAWPFPLDWRFAVETGLFTEEEIVEINDLLELMDSDPLPITTNEAILPSDVDDSITPQLQPVLDFLDWVNNTGGGRFLFGLARDLGPLLGFGGVRMVLASTLADRFVEITEILERTVASIEQFESSNADGLFANASFSHLIIAMLHASQLGDVTHLLTMPELLRAVARRSSDKFRDESSEFAAELDGLGPYLEPLVDPDSAMEDLLGVDREGAMAIARSMDDAEDWSGAVEEEEFEWPLPTPIIYLGYCVQEYASMFEEFGSTYESPPNVAPEQQGLATAWFQWWRDVKPTLQVAQAFDAVAHVVTAMARMDDEILGGLPTLLEGTGGALEAVTNALDQDVTVPPLGLTVNIAAFLRDVNVPRILGQAVRQMLTDLFIELAVSLYGANRSCLYSMFCWMDDTSKRTAIRMALGDLVEVEVGEDLSSIYQSVFGVPLTGTLRVRAAFTERFGDRDGDDSENLGIPVGGSLGWAMWQYAATPSSDIITPFGAFVAALGSPYSDDILALNREVIADWLNASEDSCICGFRQRWEPEWEIPLTPEEIERLEESIEEIVNQIGPIQL
ncbi:MAG: hypothetical protein H6739_32280 [Alphaproteobacteria bacterium]|nr:hypothetical protein [Alphaproteobacteria bacterium]